MTKEATFSEMVTDKETHLTLLQSTATIVASLVDKNTDDAWNLGELMREVYAELAVLSEEMHPASSHSGSRKMPVSIEDSIQPDYIVCLEDGKRLKMLKRYLKTNYNMTPEEYRKRWNLPATYPMVAPEYAKRRSQLAKDIGLGKDSTRLNRMKQSASNRHHESA